MGTLAPSTARGSAGRHDAEGVHSLLHFLVNTPGIAVVVTGAPMLAWGRQSPVCAREVDSNRRRRIAAPKLRPNHTLARRDRVARSAEQRAGVRIRLPPYRPRPAHIPPRVSIIVHRQLPVLNPWATSPASRLEGKVNGGRLTAHRA